MSCFTTGGPAKEHRTNKPPPTGRVQERSKGDTTCLTTSQNRSLWHPSWLNKACTTRKDSESEWLAKDNPETNTVTIKPWDCKPCGSAVLLGSLTLLLSTQVPFPNKISCFVSTCVSSDNSVPSVRQEPSFGLGRGPPSCNKLDYKESWAPKNWCFWTVVLEKTLESPLDCKEIQPVHPKGDQSWIFIGRTDAEAETPILWPPDVKSWLIWKDPDAGKVWRPEKKGTTEDEMVGWHHRLNGHEFE